MVDSKLTRRKALKLGFGSAAGLAMMNLLSCSSDANNFALDVDPDLFNDPSHRGLDAHSVIREDTGARASRPNIIVILTDDLGYGDLGCYGSRAIATPEIDAMAGHGVRFTDFYCSSPLCSPSRAGLLTGRYPLRSGITFPLQPGKDTLLRKLTRQGGYLLGALGIYDLRNAENIVDGLPVSEITIAQALKVAGYVTGAIGKWHLGDFVYNPQYYPHNYGFDFFTGFNASNDDWPAAFWRDKKEIVKDIGLDQEKYTGLFTDEAVNFIERSAGRPFFLYLAHKDPHQPCLPSKSFQGSSEGGPHGDTVREVDHSVGRIMKALKRKGIDDNTLVIFTSDNGPWFDGSPGGLRGRKGMSFEGGFRVPMVARWPRGIRPGRVCREPAMNIDFFPTFMELAGLSLPSDRVIDGRSIRGLMDGTAAKSPHEALFYFHYNEIEGARSGPWKYFRLNSNHAWPIPLDKPVTFFGKAAGGHDYRPEGSDKSVPTMASWPALYNMERDAGESYNVLKKYPGEGERLLKLMEDFEKKFRENPRGWL